MRVAYEASHIINNIYNKMVKNTINNEKSDEV